MSDDAARGLQASHIGGTACLASCRSADAATARACLFRPSFPGFPHLPIARMGMPLRKRSSQYLRHEPGHVSTYAACSASHAFTSRPFAAA